MTLEKTATIEEVYEALEEVEETPETKIVTIEEVYKALKKNGFEHIRGQWTDVDWEGLITGGCVLAQAGFNLGVELTSYSDSLERQLERFPFNDKESKWAVLNGANLVEQGLSIGSAVISWNDAQIYKDDVHQYVLKTYKEVADMAYDIMKPYFNQTIELRKKEWAFSRPLETS